MFNYIYVTLIFGVISGLVSIYFRQREISNEVILMPRQLITQIALFVITVLICREFYSHVFIDLGFLKLGWFLILLIFSSVSFYAVQVLYQTSTGNTLFATEDEMKKYIEKLERDKF